MALTLSDGLATLILKGNISPEHRPRRILLSRAGADGDVSQNQGRRARRVHVPADVLYSGSLASDVALARQARDWVDASTVLTLTGSSENGLKCRIQSLDVIERAGKEYIEIDIELIEAFVDPIAASGAATLGGVAYPEVAREEVTRE